MANIDLVSKKSAKNLLKNVNSNKVDLEDNLMSCDINDNYEHKNGNGVKRKFDSKVSKSSFC